MKLSTCLTALVWNWRKWTQQDSVIQIIKHCHLFEGYLGGVPVCNAFFGLFFQKHWAPDWRQGAHHPQSMKGPLEYPKLKASKMSGHSWKCPDLVPWAMWPTMTSVSILARISKHFPNSALNSPLPGRQELSSLPFLTKVSSRQWFGFPRTVLLSIPSPGSLCSHHALALPVSFNALTKWVYIILWTSQ